MLFVTPDLPDQEGRIEHDAKDQNDKEVIADMPAPASTLPSVFHVKFNVETYSLFEVKGLGTPVLEDVPTNTDLPRKLLLTLFRVIISPNAP